MVYCTHCEQEVSPAGFVDWSLAVFLLLCGVLPGIVYVLLGGIQRLGHRATEADGPCPMCGLTDYE